MKWDIKSYQMNSEEKSIKKNWLWATLFILFSPIINSFIFSWVAGLPKQEELIANAVVDTLLAFFIFFLPLLYCAYRGPGTAWLRFYLILYPLGLIVSIISVAVAIRGDSSIVLGKFIYTLILFVPQAALGAWWYWSSLKLLRVNRNIQSNLLRSSKEYEGIFISLEQAATLDDLNQTYYSISSSSLPGAIIDGLEKIYRQKKLFFSAQKS